MAEVEYHLADPLPSRPPSSIADNFERLYAQDQFLYLHPNGLCLIGLAPAHPALQPPVGLQQRDETAAECEPPEAEGVPAAIDFGVGRSNLLEAEFRKGRGPWLKPDTALCRVVVGGQAHLLRCLTEGHLVEVNEQLAGADGPALLKLLRTSYVAVVNLKQGEAQRLRRECLTAEQYAAQRGLERDTL